MRLPRFGLPLAWGAVYLGAWWAATPHEPRHLLPLVPLLGVPALAALPASAAGVRHAVRAGLLLSAVLSLRALCFSTAPELSARPRSYEALYGLPPEVTRAIPDGALVCNRARRPDNFALLGPRLTVRLWDFAPDAPSETDLHYHRIDYLLARGRAGELPPAPPWFRLVYDGPAVDQSGWEGHPDDRLRLYRLRAPAEK
jgi:hypothetical protein